MDFATIYQAYKSDRVKAELTLDQIKDRDGEARTIRETMRLIQGQIRMAELNLPPVVGKNADERKAAKDLLIAEDPKLQDLHQQFRQQEADLASITSDLANLDRQHALNKRFLEAEIAALHAIALTALPVTVTAISGKPDVTVPAPAAAATTLFD